MVLSTNLGVALAILSCGVGSEPLPDGAAMRWSSPELVGPVLALAFSADARHVVSGSRDGRVIVWQSTTGKAVRVWHDHTGEIKTVAVAADGKTVASAGADQMIRLCDLESGQTLHVLKGHRPTVEALVFTPDGSRLVSGGRDQAVVVWDVVTGQELHRLDRHTQSVRGLAMAHDGKTFASGGEDRNVYLWDLETGNMRLAFKRPGWVHSLSFSGDGSMLATGGRDQVVHVRKVHQSGGHDSFGGYEGPIAAVALSHDGKMVAAANDDGTIRLWEILTGEIRREFVGHKGHTHAIVFSPDEHRLISAGEDGQIIVWDMLGGSQQPAQKSALATELAQAWHDLGGPADRAFRALGRLRAHPKQLLPFVLARLEPIFKLLPRLGGLIKDLESQKFNVRQKATQELDALGDLAVPYLEELLQEKLSLETARRIELVIARARRNETTRRSTFAQMWRTIELLEASGEPARDVLRRLSKETPDTRIREESRAALRRLGLKAKRAE